MSGHTYTQDNYSNPQCAYACRGLITVVLYMLLLHTHNYRPYMPYTTFTLAICGMVRYGTVRYDCFWYDTVCVYIDSMFHMNGEPALG